MYLLFIIESEDRRSIVRALEKPCLESRYLHLRPSSLGPRSAHRGAPALAGMLALAPSALSLHNGLGATPPLGYCSWNDCASEVTEQRIKRVTRALIDTCLLYTSDAADE